MKTPNIIFWAIATIMGILLFVSFWSAFLAVGSPLYLAPILAAFYAAGTEWVTWAAVKMMV